MAPFIAGPLTVNPVTEPLKRGTFCHLEYVTQIDGSGLKSGFRFKVLDEMYQSRNVSKIGTVQFSWLFRTPLV